MAKENNTVKITTDSGFECTIDKGSLDDMRVLDALVDLQNGSTMDRLIALKNLLDRFLGAEQKEALYTHLEEKNGRAGTGEVKDLLMEIFVKLGSDGKK